MLLWYHPLHTSLEQTGLQLSELSTQCLVLSFD